MIAQLSADYVLTRPMKALTRILSYALYEGRPVTTRGRWINPIVFTMLEAMRRLPQFGRVDCPVFVVGTGRSGTTILGVALSMHRDVGFLNEPKAMWHAIQPDEDVVGNYAEAPGRYCLDESDAGSETIETARKLFAAYLFVTRARRVVDKYPELIFRVPFVKAIFPDAKFVLLSRNGWDTALSIEEWSRTHRNVVNEEVHDWWGVNRRKWRLVCSELVPREPLLAAQADAISSLVREADMGAVEWIVTMQEGLNCVKRYPDDVKLVRFEDLSADPASVLKDLFLFLDLPHDAVCVKFASRLLKPRAHHGRFSINSAVRDAFSRVMDGLGYDSAN